MANSIRVTLALVVLIALTSTPTSISAQRLQQTHTGFLHGFVSSDAMWTTSFPELGNSTIDYLSQFIEMRRVWHPNFPGKEPTFDQEWNGVRDSIAIMTGRHVLLGHSMGGMVARYVYFATPSLRSNVGGVITVATPHQGAILADSAQKMDWFIQDLNRRIDDAKPYLEVAAVIVSSWIGGIIGILIMKNNAPSAPQGGSSGADLLRAAALPALLTAGSVVQNLNRDGFDTGIPRANIVARLDNNKFMPLKVSAAANGESEQRVIDNFQKARSWFDACKVFYYGTILGSPAGRKCGWADRVMGRLDETWQRYSSGSTIQQFGPLRIHVPRDIPSDGVVPNERSVYPFGTSGEFYNMPPVVGSNHLNVYKKQAGVLRMRDAMVNIGMPAVAPLNPDPFYLADNRSVFLGESNVHGGLQFGRVYWQDEVWIAGTQYYRALGMHAPSSGMGRADFVVPVGARSFRAVFGYARQDGSSCSGDDKGNVYVDGVLKWSGGISWDSNPAVGIAIALPPHSGLLRLEVDAQGNNACAHTTWADPYFSSAAP